MNSDYEKVLIYAWVKKFIDFSILEVYANDNLEPLLHFYNPFHNMYTKNFLCSEKNIFPDKLHDVNGYSMNVPLCNFYPYMYVKLDENGNPSSEMVTAVHADILTVVERMNFTFNFSFDEKDDSFANYLTKSMRKLMNNEVNLIPIAASISFIQQMSKSSSVLTIEFIEASDLRAAVSILIMNKLYVPEEIVVYLFIIPACIVSYCLIIIYLKMCKERWEMFYALRLLFGIPIYTHPQTLVDRIIFTSIVLLSMQYSVKFYSTFLNTEMVYNEIPLNTLEEIDESGLDVYINRVYYNHVVASHNVHIQNMKPRMHAVDDISTCIEKLITGGNASVCVTMSSFTRYYANRYVNAKGKPIMKAVGAVFYEDRAAFVIEKASPYYEKFRRILQAIQEAGIGKLLKKRQTPITVPDITNARKGIFTDNIFLVQLVFVLSVGYTISFISLLIEMIVKFCQRSW